MELISIEYHDKVGVLKLDRGITNAINLQFINQLSESLKELKYDSNVKGVVITGVNDKFFSIGFDLPELVDLKEKDFRAFYHLFNQTCLNLYTFPKPTIAAITGHTIAGGCVLAICCDYRFITEERKLMGLNEIKLGVPVPYPADCILHELVGAQNAREILYTGEFYHPEESLQMGMVDQILPSENVRSESIEKAQLLGELPSRAFEIIKRNRVEIVESRILKLLDKKEQFFIKCWYSDKTRERLEEALNKF